MSDKPGRGGRRAGAGRKAKDGADKLRRVTLSLDPASLAIAQTLGGGEVSVGVRKALRLAVVKDAARIEAARADMAAKAWAAKPPVPRGPPLSKAQQRHVLSLMLDDHARKVAGG